MPCKNCTNKINDEIKLSEKIVVTDINGERIELIILNTCLTTAIETFVHTGRKRNVFIYKVTIRNYLKLYEFIINPLKYIYVEGAKYSDFTIERIDKNNFKITIKK